MQFRGDMQFFHDMLRWNTYMHNSCCHRDFAHKTEPCLIYTDCSPTAGWRKTAISHEDFMCNLEGKPVPAAMKMPGARLELFRQDGRGQSARSRGNKISLALGNVIPPACSFMAVRLAIACVCVWVHVAFGLAQDSMHGLLLGIFQHLAGLQLSSCFRGGSASR